MDDMLALDGGSAARKWKSRHEKRKKSEAAKKRRHEFRVAESADFKKRMKRWRTLRAKARAEGWEPLAYHRWRKDDGHFAMLGRPRILKQSNFIDMTGWRFGRLTVLRVCPTSQQGCQRCRYWWVKCDCGTAERRINGTNLRQGKVLSCGCLKREVVKENWRSGVLAKRKAARGRERNKPLPWQLLRLRRHFKEGSKEAKLISMVRNTFIAYEIRLGIRKPRKSWKTDRYDATKFIPASNRTEQARLH